MKRKSTKICFALAGDASKASSRVRGYWIAEELETLGHSCTLKPQHKRTDLISLAFSILSHDVIIFQKTYGRYHHWLLRFAELLGKRTYIDIDDAPSLTNEAHTMKRVAAMMRACSGVFAGSTNLLQYAQQYQPNTHLIPSAIKLRNYPLKTSEPNHQNAEICLGWIGNGGYYANDLIEILVEPLADLAQRHSIKLCIVGACKVEKLNIEFAKVPQLKLELIDSIQWSDPLIVAAHIQNFDIGLYPLIENEVNQQKCGFKALEYMACGLPVVSSRIAINGEIVEDAHTGYLADSKDAWIRSLEKLVSSAKMRSEMGIHGRKKVEDLYSTKIASILIEEIISEQKLTR